MQYYRLPAAHDSPNNGFTLLEMALVLVGIAFIMGTILIAQSMIRSAQLRAVTSEVAQYQKAFNNFRDKYLAMPGDFTGATALWGSADGVIPSDAACETTIGTGTQTCDGNGDGRIGSPTLSTSGQYEQFRAWQQLAIAGMIDGSYSGVAAATFATAITIGVNVPASKVSGGGYAVLSVLSSELGNSPYDTSLFPGINYLHFLQFGSSTGGTTYSDLSTFSPISDAWAIFVALHKYQMTMGGILTPMEALMVDEKLDDGYPGSGNVMSFQKDSPVAGSCTTTDVASTARYDTTQTSQNCAMIFELGF